jgi:hypothetical protein
MLGCVRMLTWPVVGGQGRRRDITLDEVQQHKTEDDAWMVLHGKVRAVPYAFQAQELRVDQHQWVAGLKRSGMLRQAALAGASGKCAPC